MLQLWASLLRLAVQRESSEPSCLTPSFCCTARVCVCNWGSTLVLSGRSLGSSISVHENIHFEPCILALGETGTTDMVTGRAPGQGWVRVLTGLCCACTGAARPPGGAGDHAAAEAHRVGALLGLHPQALHAAAAAVLRLHAAQVATLPQLSEEPCHGLTLRRRTIVKEVQQRDAKQGPDVCAV